MRNCQITVRAGVHDTVHFEACNAEQGPVSRVEQGLGIRARIGVQGTPTLIINGWQLANAPRDAEEYVRVTRQILTGDEPYAR